MVRYGDAMLFWCQTCNKCSIRKFGYRMSEDGLHEFNGRYIISHDDEQVFYQIQSTMEPANLDMIEPVLNWMKRQMNAKNDITYNEYTCNPPKHTDLKTINAIADAISGI